MSSNLSQLNSSSPWISDQGDGTFINPVLHADYSDPDIVRVGEDFYMTASSFGHIPGLPILHSRDLVNWSLINHAIQHMPLPGYEKPQHGNGVWAPSIRYHNSKYWIFYGDPDVGIFMTTADHPADRWSELHLVHEGKGLIDACPFWDEDDQAYLVHAYAESRSGIRHRLRVCPMSTDGKRLLEGGVDIIDDPDKQPLIEGPKMYKRNGYYYVAAPAGGVSQGWQTVLRSTDPMGPYEYRIVLQQGDTEVNGPHQGGWVELESGETWFMHFQHKGAYGRIVHLQPVRWIDNWPVIGIDRHGDGIGEPVIRMSKPNVSAVCKLEVPATDDEFDQPNLGVQWQWQANPADHWISLQDRKGHLRMFAVSHEDSRGSLIKAPFLLMQKFPALTFEAITQCDVSNLHSEERTGLIVFGMKYAAMVVKKEGNGEPRLQFIEGDTDTEKVTWEHNITAEKLQLKVIIKPGGLCTFQYKLDNEQAFEPLEQHPFQAVPGRWVGAKVGLFAQAQKESRGFADFEWFRLSGGE